MNFEGLKESCGNYLLIVFNSLVELTFRVQHPYFFSNSKDLAIYGAIIGFY